MGLTASASDSYGLVEGFPSIIGLRAVGRVQETTAGQALTPFILAGAFQIIDAAARRSLAFFEYQAVTVASMVTSRSTPGATASPYLSARVVVHLPKGPLYVIINM